MIDEGWYGGIRNPSTKGINREGAQEIIFDPIISWFLHQTLIKGKVRDTAGCNWVR